MPTISGVMPHQFEVGPLTQTPTLSYVSAQASARIQAGEEAYPSSLGSLSVYTNKIHPYTGNLLEGWKWDERVWYSEQTENSISSLPPNADPSDESVTTEYFQSGIGFDRDLEVNRIVEVPSSGLVSLDVSEIWAPEVRHGYFYDYNEDHYLFCDSSVVVYPSYSGVVHGISSDYSSAHNQIYLTSTPKTGIPIHARKYEWNSETGKYDVLVEVEKVGMFTGVRDSDGVQLETYNSSTNAILFENIDPGKNEMMVAYSGVIASGTYPSLIFTRQYSIPVGSGLGATATPSGMELVGYSTGEDGQEYHLSKVPVDQTIPVEVVSYVSSDSLTNWNVSGDAAIMSGISVSGYNCFLDYDLGILRFGSPATISGQQCPVAGATIRAAYNSTLRVEYEPEYSNDYILATEVNTNPLYRHSGQGFLYLSTSVADPATITLEAELPELQTNLYGPLYIGNSFATLIATVKDRKGLPLEDQNVNVWISSDPVIGSFSGSTDTNSITNEDGEAFAFYIPPRSVSELGEYITASGYSTNAAPVGYDGVSHTTTLQTSNLLIEGGTDTIYLYQVYTDDPVVGYLRNNLDQTDTDLQIKQYYNEFFEDEGIYGPTASGTSTTWEEWEAGHRTLWNLVRPTLFSSEEGNGRKVIVATLNSGFLDPHTFTSPTVAPVQPIDMNNISPGVNDLVFDTTYYSIPPPSGTLDPRQGTLHSYFVVAPTSVKMKASVYNQRLNQTIESNEIQVRLNIPTYMNGVWVIDEINDIHIDEISALLSTITASGQRVPLGFRLRSANISLAAALDGITFLDVNSDPVEDAAWDDVIVQSGIV